MEYVLIKWIHIVSSTILFGTGIGSAFYLFMANRRKEITAMYFSTRHVVIADWLFTTPAVIIQLVTGVRLMQITGYSLSNSWILWSIILFLFVGACWLPVVWLQIKMRDMAKFSLETEHILSERYWRLNLYWIILGSLAFPATLVIFYLMVAKPLF